MDANPDRIFAKPAEGRTVRKESDMTSFVNEEGELLPNTSYYRRRLKWGDLVEIVPPAQTTSTSGGK